MGDFPLSMSSLVSSRAHAAPRVHARVDDLDVRHASIRRRRHRLARRDGGDDDDDDDDDAMPRVPTASRRASPG
tara:strand:- start:697 stop:918 length:222 start_codon:yes stop_codon:yes gene_type:complete